MTLIKHKPYLLDILIIISLAIIPFLMSGLTGIIDKTDADFPLYPIDTFLSHLFVWSSQLGLGYTQALSTTPQLFPYYFFIAFFNYIGLPTGLVERIWLVTVFSMLGISMYYLMLNLIDSKIEGKRIACLISGIFYMFNPFVITYIQMGEHTALWVHAMWPLLFIFIIQVMNFENKFTNNIIFIGIISMGIQIADPGVTFIIIIPIVLYFIYEFLIQNNKIKVIKLIFFISCVSFFLSAWWIVAMVLALLSLPTFFSHVTGSSSEVLIFASERLTISNTIRLWGYYFEQLTPNLISFVSSKSSIILGFISAILAFSALMFQQKNKFVSFFGILAVIGAIFSLGIGSHFGNIYNLIWDIFPPFKVLRQPYKFVGILSFAYSILIGFALVSLYSILRTKFLKVVLIISALLLVFLISYPFITGEYYIFTNQPVNTQIDKHFQDSLEPVDIPLDYINLREYLKSQNTEFRILILPEETWLLKYKWSPYDLAEILKYTSPKPVLYGGPMISTAFPNSLDTIESIYSIINQNSSLQSGKILGTMNVRYLLVRNDTENYIGQIIYPAPYVKNIINNQEGIQLEKTFGNLDIYRVSDKYFLPHIYTVDKFIFMKNITDTHIYITSAASIIGDSIIFSLDQLTPNQTVQLKHISEKSIYDNLTSVHSYHPNIYFSRINPTKYEISVTNATKPFFLVFSESNSPGWQAYINVDKTQCNPIHAYKNVNVTECKDKIKFFEIGDLTRTLLEESIPEKNHFIANGYANAWYIDSPSNDQNFTVTLYYKPQSYFNIGLMVSGITFIFCIGYLLRDWMKRIGRDYLKINKVD